MKKWLFLLAIIVTMSSFTGCSLNQSTTTENEQIKAVSVMEVKENQRAVTLDYIGTIDAEELVKYSFKLPGQINKIYVTKGDYVKSGDKLAELDTTDLAFQVEAAKATMDTAAENIAKAEASLHYINSTYDRMTSLYENGAISQDQFDQAQLKKEVSASEYAQAKAQYHAAKTDYDSKMENLENTTIYAKQDGYMVEKTLNENERVGAYTPVIIIRSEDQIVNVGIPQQELPKIYPGAEATVKVDDKVVPGQVTNIAQIPDETTRTYTAEIMIYDSTLMLGSIAKVSIAAGVQEGIWIPMTSLYSDGDSYVFIINDGRAFRRTVTIQSNSDDQVLVTGLNPDDQLVVSGMDNLDDGVKVKVN